MGDKLFNIFTFASSYSYVVSSLSPIIKTFGVIGSLLSVLFLVIGAFNYITSSASPEKLEKSKKIIKNALIGLVIVISASFISNFLINTYGPVNNHQATSIPSISAIKTNKSSNGLIDIVIKTISGVLGSIIETIGIPFIAALAYFLKATPLVSTNTAVLKLWLICLGIADGLLILAITLIGLKIITSTSLGFKSVDLRELLPQILVTFMFMNFSIYLIDYLIQISNIMIKAISSSNIINNFWKALETIVGTTSGYSLAILLIMLIFLILSIILLIFYLGRLITIYLGAVLSPIVILCFLIPGFRDSAISMIKKYVSVVFVLFVHVVIIELAASLLVGIYSNSSNLSPLMALVLGLAALFALIKTQGVLAELAVISVVPRMARKLSQRMVLNLSYGTSMPFNSMSQAFNQKNNQDTPNNSNNSGSLNSSSPNVSPAGGSK